MNRKTKRDLPKQRPSGTQSQNGLDADKRPVEQTQSPKQTKPGVDEAW